MPSTRFHATNANGENVDPNSSNIYCANSAASAADENKSNDDDDRKPAAVSNESVTNRLPLLEATMNDRTVAVRVSIDASPPANSNDDDDRKPAAVSSESVTNRLPLLEATMNDRTVAVRVTIDEQVTIDASPPANPFEVNVLQQILQQQDEAAPTLKHAPQFEDIDMNGIVEKNSTVFSTPKYADGFHAFIINKCNAKVNAENYQPTDDDEQYATGIGLPTKTKAKLMYQNLQCAGLPKVCTYTMIWDSDGKLHGNIQAFCNAKNVDISSITCPIFNQQKAFFEQVRSELIHRSDNELNGFDADADDGYTAQYCDSTGFGRELKSSNNQYRYGVEVTSPSGQVSYNSCIVKHYSGYWELRTPDGRAVHISDMKGEALISDLTELCGGANNVNRINGYNRTGIDRTIDSGDVWPNVPGNDLKVVRISESTTAARFGWQGRDTPEVESTLNMLVECMRAGQATSERGSNALDNLKRDHFDVIPNPKERFCGRDSWRCKYCTVYRQGGERFKSKKARVHLREECTEIPAATRGAILEIGQYKKQRTT